ncbi:2-oxoacid:acceptor oxidoreductase [Neisseria brasiliensis]|uniref:2-oxoacid:acceptor oxidoreductase n=1 Tax=Neisseria TaxID=482 RepID=UPI000C2737D2|nr:MULTISPECIES: 2-oxoacid:acceptor oxidoreductase [Neisseria]PJO78226.1 2-oxoacid:acceptor oxidoreductase [Neisseria sp. N177_16]QGL25038.1 2-oxoacid:acceptor oxidoreductase [Neisseria brasiliensis]
MKKFFEIFKSGTRTDNNGRTVTITDADVAQAAAAYDPKLHEAPLVVGHPKTDAPAYGWVGGLHADGGVLSADFAQMDDDFVGLVQSGRYKKVSASFYPPDSPSNPKPGSWYLRHVGFLGAQPPAVKGLSAINFAEDDVYVEFSEAAHSYSAGLFRRLREFLIEKFGIEEADKAVPNWQIDSIEEAAKWKDPILEPAFADPATPTDPETHENKETPMSPEEQLAAEKAAREQAEAKAAAAEAELKRLKDEQERDLREGKHEQNAEFAEALVKEGRLKPADKALMVQVLDFADYPEQTSVEFGEGSTIGEALRQFLRGLPEVLPSGHHAKGAAPAATGGLSADFAEAANPDALSHHERAVALAAKEGIPYEEAARRTAV